MNEEIENLKDQLLRKSAELENFKKRSQKNLQTEKDMAKIDVINSLLPSIDCLKLAIESVNTSDKNISQGLNLVMSHFEKALSNIGLEKIPDIGEYLDPNLHEAISISKSDIYKEGKIIKVIKTGYKMGDRLVRPSSVIVSG